MKWMFKFKSLLLVFLALLLTACQTSNTQQLEDKFATFERSALSALQQSLDSDLKFESVPTAVKVRDQLDGGADPGWYQPPDGTQAYKVDTAPDDLPV
jgi:hypothetical protein